MLAALDSFTLNLSRQSHSLLDAESLVDGLSPPMDVAPVASVVEDVDESENLDPHRHTPESPTT
jgi:hypothetical protein